MPPQASHVSGQTKATPSAEIQFSGWRHVLPEYSISNSHALGGNKCPIQAARGSRGGPSTSPQSYLISTNTLAQCTKSSTAQRFHNDHPRTDGAAALLSGSMPANAHRQRAGVRRQRARLGHPPCSGTTAVVVYVNPGRPRPPRMSGRNGLMERNRGQRHGDSVVPLDADGNPYHHPLRGLGLVRQVIRKGGVWLEVSCGGFFVRHGSFIGSIRSRQRVPHVTKVKRDTNDQVPCLPRYSKSFY
ncbi:hypothetical protein LZ30DRAFT_723006 [Colletotrichum cereale]|nr:hypothetical protein LZ30DRAFT_723006 [Colletotrichum cereale]